MSQLRTIIKTRPARGFGVPAEDYEQLQVKHEFEVIEVVAKGIKRGSMYGIQRIIKPKWEDVPHVMLNGSGKR